ncbi:MAG: SWIM zinc finger family protein, partial [Acetatifactor sp.]|nr:SWIM zinc finger family protein [Acetatifactor sp.]
YKDLEAAGSETQAAAGLDRNAPELTVAAGGETVTIRLPLGESRCSCPSRSICRHVIMAILLAQQAVTGGESGAGETTQDQSTGKAGTGSPDDQSIEQNQSSDNRYLNPESAGNSVSSNENPEGNNNGDLKQQVWQEILAQPRKPLLRALGSKGLRRLVAAMEAGSEPMVERSTVVRMQLPGQDMTVKLLSPLEYSTCACHKKELCSHKAEAILWCQYLEKQLTALELAGELEQEPAFDLQELQNTAKQVRDCLEHLLETGLARSSAAQAQELERLAILCHNAELPGWEGDIRALAEGYEKYLRRAAGQTMEKLTGQLQRLYNKTIQLGALIEEALSSAEKADPQQIKSTTARIQALAGEFRSEYLPVGDLELTGITMEHFVSDSGYEGDTVYFLEIATGTWYTYTNARPTFYEGKKRRGYQEKAAAPWGIPLPLEGLAGVQLQLRGAKCDAGGRLSSSQETKGEILGKSELTAAKLEGWYYRRYDRLFAEQIQRPAKVNKDHLRLVFVQAARFEQGRFNEITQKLELPIWDEEERQVLVELPYSKREEASIRYLERLKKKQQPCFLGRVYLQGSRICLYPVDLLERQELEGTEDGGVMRKAAEGASADRVVRTAGHDMGACHALQGYLEEVSWLLQEIYQVGSATVQDSTLEALKRAEKQAEAYGMTTLSEWLRQLGEQLAQSRHRLRQQSSETVDVYCRLWQYVQLCRQRTAYDMASLVYQGI